MTEVTEYFDRLLWFIYRVIFTVLPSVMFLCIILSFLISVDVYSFEEISLTVQKFGFFQWSIVFSVAFCMNLILESFTNFLAYRTLNFYNISRKVLNNDKILVNLLSKFNPEVLAEIQNENNEFVMGAATFNFGLLKSNSKSIWFNNYVWFLISREFLFCNTSFVILTSSLLFIPYLITAHYGLNTWYFVCLQILQLVFSAFVLFSAKKIIELNYREILSSEDKNSYFSKNARENSKYLLAPVSFFLLSMVCLLLNLDWAFILLVIYSGLLLIVPLLFLRAMREFVHVEYLILMSFAKDNEE